MNLYHACDSSSFRVIHDGRVWKLSPKTFAVWLYLCRQLAVEKSNSFIWVPNKQSVDVRTAGDAHLELKIAGLLPKDSLYSSKVWTLLDPTTGEPLKYPDKGKRFQQGVHTFWFPWRVLDYRRLSFAELKVYAYLWRSTKTVTTYDSDFEIEIWLEMRQRTVELCMSNLRTIGYIRCSKVSQYQLQQIKNKSDGVRAQGGEFGDIDARSKTFRKTVMCDPDRPHFEYRQRLQMERSYFDPKQIKDGDMLELLGRLGVTVFNQTGETIYCSANSLSTNDWRKVHAGTGLSFTLSDERNSKGRRKRKFQTLLELAAIQKGEAGHAIVKHWYDDLLERNKRCTETPQQRSMREWAEGVVSRGKETPATKETPAEQALFLHAEI